MPNTSPEPHLSCLPPIDIAQQEKLCFAHKHIVIWGVGLHGGGLAAAHFCAKRGARISLLDKLAESHHPEGSLAQENQWPWYQGDQQSPILKEADYIICSPAIPPRLLQHDIIDRVLSPEALFFAVHRGPRIAITGTKGKSSSVAMLSQLLNWPNAGNSFIPLLDFLEKHGESSPLICELSSFQLYYLQALKPSFLGGICTNLDSDHLDWHPDLNHYHHCKEQLKKWCENFIAPKNQNHFHFDETSIYQDDIAILNRDSLGLNGDHQIKNYCRLRALIQKISERHTNFREQYHEDILKNRSHALKALPHRMQIIHQDLKHNITYIDDSCATTPIATLAALSTLNPGSALLIGGKDKGGEYTQLIEQVSKQNIFVGFYGANGSSLAKLLSQQSNIRAQYAVHATLSGAFQAAQKYFKHGKNTDPQRYCLLSPASASLDQFVDYAARGKAFQDLACST